jgi:hypothetical protein
VLSLCRGHVHFFYINSISSFFFKEINVTTSKSKGKKKKKKKRDVWPLKTKNKEMVTCSID